MSHPLLPNHLMQISLCNALEQGVYAGDCAFSSLPHDHNIMGLGTFQDLDGEMIALDGTYFQITSDGRVTVVKDDQVTPFSQILNFESEAQFSLGNTASYDELNTVLLSKLPKKNFPYALRIDGKMNTLKIRSVCKQATPYPVIAEAIKGQAIFDLEEVEGSLIGFWFPAYWEKISIAGLHFHFISNDRQYGGHVLNISLQQGLLRYALLKNISISLPDTDLFAQAELSGGEDSFKVAQV